MEIFQDLYHTNLTVLKNSINSIRKNWGIVLTGIFYIFATIFLYYILRFFWILAGLVLLIATSALISNYLHLLEGIIRRNRITMQDFKEGFGIYLRKVWGLLFLFYVAQLAYTLLAEPIISTFIHPLLARNLMMFIVFIVLNPIPEVLYQKYYSPWESISYSFEFIKDNWIEWYIPNIIFIGLMYLLTGELISGVINYYAPVNLLARGGIVTYLLGQVLFSFMMIYRGYLFETLSTSNRRKRLFMRKF
ncbi:hypothetical protein [Alkaliphilus transvaalensis]|uniref:hypothetical protein n=1 Tax=Alkaliphilus transvaalensis TaxID=114628 RepID=UPI0004798549|nr:hypothetical protein [Alkaliphilus transvaalensis]